MIIKTISNYKELKPYLPEMWLIIKASYEPLGGCKAYKNENAFYSLCKCARLVFNEKDQIIAVATYRTGLEYGRKMISIGSDGSQEGKTAVQTVIQEDIKDKDLGYWVEASGTIEHYCKKYNGYPVINNVAVKVLTDLQFRADLVDIEDLLHYNRYFGASMNDVEIKSMFGFKDINVYNQTLEALKNTATGLDYENFRKLINSTDLKEATQEELNLVKEAAKLIDKALNLYWDQEIRDFPPDWILYIEKAIHCLKTIDVSKDLKQEVIEQYIADGEFILQHVSPMVLHKFEFKKESS